jgi:hypothetical protein
MIVRKRIPDQPLYFPPAADPCRGLGGSPNGTVDNTVRQSTSGRGGGGSKPFESKIRFKIFKSR